MRAWERGERGLREALSPAGEPGGDGHRVTRADERGEEHPCERVRGVCCLSDAALVRGMRDLPFWKREVFFLRGCGHRAPRNGATGASSTK